MRQNFPEDSDGPRERTVDAQVAFLNQLVYLFIQSIFRFVQFRYFDPQNIGLLPPVENDQSKHFELQEIY